MIKLKKTECLLLLGLLLISFVPSFGGLLRMLELATNASFLPTNSRVNQAPSPVVIHVISSVLFCLLGAIQFLKSIRLNHPKMHKLFGRLLVVAGVLSAASGLWMTHFYAFPEALQGTLLYVVRIVVSIGMIVCLYKAVSAILHKKTLQHQAWIIRAYALAQGAGTQVLVAIPWLIAGNEPSGVTRDILMSVAWLINLAVAELIIRNISLASGTSWSGYRRQFLSRGAFPR